MSEKFSEKIHILTITKQILELKIWINEIRNPVESRDGRFKMAEEWISNLKEILFKVNQPDPKEKNV
jgi:hypothetical protein